MNDVLWLVVTDLDGTLLDHDDYSFAPALPALQRLRSQDVPVILNTSKTRAELASLRLQLGNRDPFVVENGSAVFVPVAAFGSQPAGTERCGEHYCRVLGLPRADILAALQPLRRRYRFEGFSDWDAAALVAHTGLDPVAARQALEREFSEPLWWRDSADALSGFRGELAALGLSTLQGGRFLHVQGACDKGRSLGWLRQLYGARCGRPVRVIALGDSENDIAMLAAADVAVVIRSRHHEPPAVPGGARVIVSAADGPLGWNEIIGALLADGTL